MRILFVCHGYPNYIPDLLLHGLRWLVGPDVVDFPRKDCLYEGVMGLGVCPDNQRFDELMPSDQGIDRDDIERKVEAGYFNLILADIRSAARWGQMLLKATCPLALIDGEDKPAKVAVGNYAILRRETDGSDFSIPLPMALPSQAQRWIARYDGLPKIHSVGFLGARSNLTPERNDLLQGILDAYPDSLIRATEVPNAANSLPQGRMGRDDYYRSIQQCRVLLTLPGAGFDTFRYWEHAACTGVHLAARMPLFIPDDFAEYRSILRFSNPGEARRAIDLALESADRANGLAECSRAELLAHHTTERRAEYVLRQLKRAFP